MAECDQDVLGNEEIIANVKGFLRDGCGCSRGVKGGPCCQQFSEEVVLSNINNCLKLIRAERDLVILAKAIPFFSPFSVVRPTQMFGIFKKKKKVTTFVNHFYVA